MIDDQYLEVLDKIHQYFHEKYGLSGRELCLARVAKLTEEVGELASETLSHCELQRLEKQDKHTKQTLASEWADAVGSLFLLGKVLDIDMNQALEDRLKVITERYQITFNETSHNGI